MLAEFQGHRLMTLVDEENSTFWWEREGALHRCIDCGQMALVFPAQVGNPDTEIARIELI